MNWIRDEAEAMRKLRKKAARNTTEVGQAVIASLREIRAWQRGELKLNVVEVPEAAAAARKARRRKAAR